MLQAFNCPCLHGGDDGSGIPAGPHSRIHGEDGSVGNPHRTPNQSQWKRRDEANSQQRLHRRGGIPNGPQSHSQGSDWREERTTSLKEGTEKYPIFASIGRKSDPPYSFSTRSHPQLAPNTQRIIILWKIQDEHRKTFDYISS